MVDLNAPTYPHKQTQAPLPGLREELLGLLPHQHPPTTTTTPKTIATYAQAARAFCLELDSSTPAKFSRHLIVHLPGGRLFRSNIHAGRLVRRLLAAAGPPPSVEGGKDGGSVLWVARPLPEEGEGVAAPAGAATARAVAAVTGEDDPMPAAAVSAPSSFPFTAPVAASPTPAPCLFVFAVDTGVYTKNRAFRCWGSRKFGQGKGSFELTEATRRHFRPPGAYSG